MSRVDRVFRSSLAVLAVALLACSKARPEGNYELTIRVTGDVGRPLSGARVLFKGGLVGRSNERGQVELAVRGREGEVITVTVACPDGFRSPTKPLDVPLRKLAEPGTLPEFSVACQPLTRAVVVVVRADNGPDLPIRYLGQEVARTDGSGAAHVLLRLAPHEEFELTLDTTDKRAENLRPQSPSARFTAKDTDEIFTFNVPFATESRPAGRARVKKDVPVRL